MKTGILATTSLLTVALCGACFAETTAPPNIVFIMADDLGWADVAFHGGNTPTPHLDRLAEEGLELTQHYVAPVCSPTRTGLLTGRCWSRFGITTPTNELALPPDTVTLPRALQSVGYDTCLVGKWHLGSLPKWGPNHFGFDHSYGSLAGGISPWNHFYKKGPYSVTWHRNETLIEETGPCHGLADERSRPVDRESRLRTVFSVRPLHCRAPADQGTGRVARSGLSVDHRRRCSSLLRLRDAPRRRRRSHPRSPGAGRRLRRHACRLHERQRRQHGREQRPQVSGRQLPERQADRQQRPVARQKGRRLRGRNARADGRLLAGTSRVRKGRDARADHRLDADVLLPGRIRADRRFEVGRRRPLRIC